MKSVKKKEKKKKRELKIWALQKQKENHCFFLMIKIPSFFFESHIYTW